MVERACVGGGKAAETESYGRGESGKEESVPYISTEPSFAIASVAPLQLS